MKKGAKLQKSVRNTTKIQEKRYVRPICLMVAIWIPARQKCCSGDLCNKENIFNVSHMVFGRCYTCNSDTSLEDCETNQLVNNCTGSEEKCFQFEMTFTVGSEQRKVFEKGCEAPEKCEKFDKDSEEEICKANLPDGGNLDTCKAKCCSGDLCNKENIFNGGHMVFGRCYTCNSDTSHEDCETNQLVNNCTGSEEKCLQFEMTFTVGSEQRKVFEKGCEAPEKCEKYNKESGKELCKANLTDGGNLDTCKAKCCSGDLCNKENIFNGGHMVFGSFLLPLTMVVISMTIS